MSKYFIRNSCENNTNGCVKDALNLVFKDPIGSFYLTTSKRSKMLQIG